MRSLSSPLRPLLLAGFCLLATVSAADANPPPVIYPTLQPYYFPGGYVTPGVYGYPQVVTTPRHYPVYPAYYPYGYPAGWYGDYRYTTGSYYYWSSPRGTSFYYTSPGFYYRYRVR